MEEKMSDKLVVCMGKGAQKDLAVSLAKKIICVTLKIVTRQS